MKKFLLKFSIFFAYAFLLQVVFPYVVDPFNVFHAENIRENGISPNRHYIKMKYVLKNPNKFDSFIFGSSRVGAIHPEKIPNEKIYNMCYSVALPSENLANIKTFINSGVHILKIYLGVDSLSYTHDVKERIDKPIQCPYEYLCDYPLYFYYLYLNPIEARRSLFIKNVDDKFVNDFYKYGYWYEYGRKTKFDWNTAKIEPTIGRHNFLSETLKNINEIVKICKEHGIELIIFTNPMHHITYQASVEKNYFEFLERLAKITDFYNFSSLNDVTLNNDNYLETSHYKAEVGDMIIEVICNSKKYDGLYEQGFGVKVTKENVDDFINMLKAQMKNYSK